MKRRAEYTKRAIAVAIALVYPLLSQAGVAVQPSGADTKWCHMEKKVGDWDVRSDHVVAAVELPFTWQHMAPWEEIAYRRYAGALLPVPTIGEISFIIPRSLTDVRHAKGRIDLHAEIKKEFHLRITANGTTIYNGSGDVITGVDAVGNSTIDLESLLPSLFPALAAGKNIEIMIGKSSSHPWLKASFGTQSFKEAGRLAVSFNKSILAEAPNRPKCEPNCFITTAVCENVGLADDCFELRTLRAFRDGPLLDLPAGREAVELYYSMGPTLVAELRRKWTVQEWRRLYAFRIVPCVAFVMLRMHSMAFKLYQRMVAELRTTDASDKGMLT